jgi:RNA 2',3'-cyclic 3'-phosphodiesterase
MPRLFAAVDLPDDVKDKLTLLCSGMSGAKWVGRDQMHLTLHFIGEVDDTDFSAIKNALAEVRAASFEMRLTGAGQFPPKGQVRVLWVGVEAPPTLTDLQRKIEGALTAVGLPREDRPFSPHITLARLKTPPAPETIRQYLAQHATFSTEAIPVESFVLYSSRLAPSGATYHREGIFKLYP